MESWRTETGEIDMTSDAARAGHQLLLARIERIKERKGVDWRIAQWRDASEEHRGRMGASLMRMTAAALAGRAVPYEKGALRYPRIPNVRRGEINGGV